MTQDNLLEEQHDLLPVMGTAVGFFNYKMIFFLFMLYIFLSSTLFIDKVLGTFGGAVKNKTPTNWGVIIQGICLVLGYAILDILIYNGIV